MRLRCGAAPGRQDELLQLRQLVIEMSQRLVQRQNGLGLQQLEARDRQLAAQVEELVLHLDEYRAHAFGERFAQQKADVRVELINVPHGANTQTVLGDTRVVSQTG